ncbi:MAG: SlyX family protein [Desulfuromonadaceae bacterium]|nr:SlyX family protein [Desulfuromonadaceae bacterium]
MSEDKEKWIDLETRMAYLEYQNQELISQLAEQQKQIFTLEGLCQTLVRRLKNLAVSDTEEGHDARPPHY